MDWRLSRTLTYLRWLTRNDEVQSLGMSQKASSLPVVTGTDGPLVDNNNALFDDTSLLMGVTLNYKMKHERSRLILIKHSMISHINIVLVLTVKTVIFNYTYINFCES